MREGKVVIFRWTLLQITHTNGWIGFYPLLYSVLGQNRRQKVFNRGALQFCGGLFVCAGELDIIKLTKTPLIYSVSRFNWGGLELCLRGLSPPKPPMATGLYWVTANKKESESDVDSSSQVRVQTHSMTRVQIRLQVQENWLQNCSAVVSNDTNMLTDGWNMIFYVPNTICLFQKFCRSCLQFCNLPWTANHLVRHRRIMALKPLCE